MSYTVSIEIRFDAAHRLYSYEGKCRNLHGHSWSAVVEVACANLVPPGFVIDFSVLKKTVKDWIYANWDHAVILWVNDPLAQILTGQDLPVYLMDHEPTAEHMAELLFHTVGQLLALYMAKLVMSAEGEELPDTAVVTQVSIMETPTSTATYS